MQGGHEAGCSQAPGDRCVFKELNVTSDLQVKHFVWEGLGTEVMPLRDQSWRKLTNSQSREGEATSFHRCRGIQPTTRIQLIS